MGAKFGRVKPSHDRVALRFLARRAAWLQPCSNFPTMAATTGTRSSLDNIESNAHIDKAKAVIEKIKATSLSIIQARTNFEKKISEF